MNDLLGLRGKGSWYIPLESKLKADFAANNHWPLADATLYGEDLGRADVSEGVAGTIAKSLSGSNAKNVLDRLLRSTTNVLVYSYVDVTSYALFANLPADVVRILPWDGVVSGAMGAAPEGFSGLINGLVQLGPLFDQGLVALRHVPREPRGGDRGLGDAATEGRY